MPKCRECNIEKDLSEFYTNKSRKIGYNTRCKVCERDYKRNLRVRFKDKYLKKEREIRAKNRDRKAAANNKYSQTGKGKKTKEDCIKTYRKQPATDEQKRKSVERATRWAKENKEKRKKYLIEYSRKNSKKNVERTRKWRLNNPEKYKKQQERRRKNPLNLLQKRISSSVLRALNGKNLSKTNKTSEIIGCSWDFLKNYLNLKSLENMDLDHIVPIKLAENKDDINILNHYSNLQIVESKFNAIKSDRFIIKENLEKVINNSPFINRINELIKKSKIKIITKNEYYEKYSHK